MVTLPHWPIPYINNPVKLGLERVKELLERLGNPHLNLPPVIHVAGTNGKGSTIAYLHHILESAGYKVHKYISPHLVRFNERIMLCGQEISDNFLESIIEETRFAAKGMQTTFFEGTTVAAFLAFSKIKADILLLETGLGGRLDATNIINKPLLSIITPISYDHMEYLGDTLSKIALEKAGIIKKEVPCVISWQTSEVMEVLRGKCKEMNSYSFSWGQEWNFNILKEGFEFIDDEEGYYEFPKPSLKGPHQIINANTAIAALQFLTDFNIKYTDIKNGLINTKWPARMEKIEKGLLWKLLRYNDELWIDGAHNIAGAEMVSVMLDEWACYDNKDLFIINGRTQGRDIESFLQCFHGKAKNIIAVKVKSEPRGEEAYKISKAAKKLGWLDSIACDSLKDAILHICDKSKNPVRILVCGSLYLAADILIANKI